MESIEDFAKILNDCFRLKFSGETESKYVFKIKANFHGQFKEYESYLPKDVFMDLFHDWEASTIGVNLIEREGYFECLVKNELNTSGRKDIETKINKKNITFEIGTPSTLLLCNALSSLSQGVGYSSENSFPDNYILNKEFFEKVEENRDTIEQIKYLTKNWRSVKVESSHYDKETLRRLVDSFLYEINSSFSEAFTTVGVSIYDLFRSNKHYGPIRKRYDELKAPSKIYDREVLGYYQRAIATNKIEFQYLSFYQILEYFYDKYFSEKMSIELLKLHNESPFVLEDNSSRIALIESITKRYRSRSYNSERSLLKSVLESNIKSKEMFKEIVCSVDKKVLEYLKDPWPGFLDFISIDCDTQSMEEIVPLLADRIYMIRNEVTHRKSKRARFLPQEHERYLLYEIRLLQAIVELIIENSGREYNC